MSEHEKDPEQLIVDILTTEQLEIIDTWQARAVAEWKQRADTAEAKLVAVPAYAHYFSEEALRLRVLGDMLGTPMTFDEWLAAGEQEPDELNGFG